MTTEYLKLTSFWPIGRSKKRKELSKIARFHLITGALPALATRLGP